MWQGEFRQLDCRGEEVWTRGLSDAAEIHTRTQQQSRTFPNAPVQVWIELTMQSGVNGEELK